MSVEKPVIGSKKDFENRLMSTVRQLGIVDLQELEKVVDERLDVLNKEGVHTRDEAYAGFLRDNIRSSDIRYIAAIQWDNVYGGRVSDIFAFELQAKHPAIFGLR